MNYCLKPLLLALLCLGPVAWAQAQHENAMSGDPKPSNVQIVKTWNLGVYPGGTWVNTTDINDFGFAVGTGDVPNKDTGVLETHTLGVALFGPQQGNWIDMGTLGGVITGWDEAVLKVSNTGVVATHSAVPDGRWHAAAWTEKTGMFDLGTLVDLGYADYKQSAAYAINRSGTLIVGIGWTDDGAHQLPIVWTPSLQWNNHQFSTVWKMQVLPITGFEEYPIFIAWEVNDVGQIIGLARNPAARNVGVVWNPLPHGQGWKPIGVPSYQDMPFIDPYAINNHGVIIGSAVSADGLWFSIMWKPLNPQRDAYGPPVLLKQPDGFPYGFPDGINELGDITGTQWGDVTSEGVLWSMSDPDFVASLGLPGDWSNVWKVNNFRIAIGFYGGGPCTISGGACAAATQYRYIPSGHH